MKRNQIIILAVFGVLTFLIFGYVVATKKSAPEQDKVKDKEVFVPIVIAKNHQRLLTIASYGQISPAVEIDIAFEVQGRILAGTTWKPGMRFSKGQTLYQVDNVEARYSLNAAKTNLANLMISLLPDIELDYTNQTNKYIDFLNAIQPDKPLPELPNVASGKERMFFTSKGLYAQYFNLKSQEERYAKYTYRAPFNGTILETYAQPGSFVGPGTRIAKISQTGDLEVKIPIALENLTYFKNQSAATFYNSAGELVGTGKISRISDIINQNTQSVDVYYSIQPKNGSTLYNGLFVNAKIDRKVMTESFALPRFALNENKVRILTGSEIKDQTVEIVGEKPDSVFVTGLKDGQQVLLEQITLDPSVKKYTGIVR